MESGIYVIRNIQNQKVYVGSTKNFSIRKKTHFSKLRSQKHQNVKLQRAFNKYSEDSFIFEIIQIAPYQKQTIVELEQFWINSFNAKKSGYNIADAAFGDTLSAHPDKENIKKKISAGLKKSNIGLSEQEWKERYPGCPGELNGMFGEKHTVETKTLISLGNQKRKKLSGHGATWGISKTDEHKQKMSKNAKEKIGNKNPFFGKKHSAETKIKISEKNKNRRPCNTKQISVNGKIFSCRRLASEATGLKQETLWYRANNKNFTEIFWV